MIQDEMAKLLQPDTSARASAHAQSVHPLLGTASIDQLGLGITWRNTLGASKLLSHVDQDIPLPTVFPVSGYIKIASEASLRFSDHESFGNSNLRIFCPKGR